MENKTILITGANGGLGSAFVKALIEQNPKKIYCGVRDLKSLEVFQEFAEKIEGVELDITDSESIKSAVAKIDTLDILINNAGVNSNSRLFDSSFQDIEVNLKGVINLTQALYPKLKNSKGTVINITSVLALINLPLMGNYCISKSALHSFTQALRAEFELFEGEVYEVLPGPIETRMTEGFPIPKTKPEDIVDAVLKAIAKKEFEIYPDSFSQMIKERLKKEPEKLLEEFNQSIQPQN